ncbi:hypothetical protein BaRGS_00017320 [Batillaria attramentaria]|uniref:Uncharacterized protein n=1 Tax=Batillaria attramentaria TaxID=370345 RepID=A0ABD0KWQ3_9CAEN
MKKGKILNKNGGFTATNSTVRGIGGFGRLEKKTSHPSLAEKEARTAQWAVPRCLRAATFPQSFTPASQIHLCQTSGCLSSAGHQYKPGIHCAATYSRQRSLPCTQYPAQRCSFPMDYWCTTESDDSSLTQKNFAAYWLMNYMYISVESTQSADCDADEVGVAIISCQHERETLSHASKMNNTTQLCQALQKYAECIEPKIAGCKDEALVAFRVIKQKYTAEPFNCHVDDYTDDGDGGDEDNHLDTGNDHMDSHNNHIMPSTQPEQFAGVTVAGLPDPETAKDNKASKEPPKQTDDNDKGNVNSSTSYSPNISSIMALFTSVCLFHRLRFL